MWAWTLLVLAAAAARADELFIVAPDLWDRPRTALTVREQPAVRQALDLYLSRPGARVLIHHGYGQDPLVQAEELRAWLMALAVDGARVDLINDVKPNEPLRLEVVK